MGLPKRLGFTMSRIDYGGAPRRAARFACTRCDATIDVPLRGGMVVAPDFIAKMATHEGWMVNSETAGATRCPRCKPGGARQGELIAEAVYPPKGRRMPAHDKVTPIKPPPAAVVPTPLSTEQRVLIRNYLDKHFDDAVGLYLDGFTDERIATLLDVPRVHIEQVREAAYGPIRINPAVAKLTSDIAALRRDIDEAQGRLAQMQDRVGALEADLSRLAAA
jgi:hypothetical protein